MIRGGQALKLPVGDVPDWEVDGSDSEPPDLKSPAESYVILQSLKQSREKWLREMFPKFSSRGRGGKQPDVVPPPHTIYNRGRCTLQIGPHLFVDTTVFEVHYRLIPVPVTQPTAFVYQSASTTSQSQTQPLSVSATAGDPNALLSSLSSALPVTPDLITQVNAAATSNPTLSNLLQLTASGRATPDQLKTLGLLIQSLSTTTTGVSATTSQPTTSTSATDSPSTPIQTTSAMTQQYQYQQVVKEFDIVLEFRESPTDRWIFPRGPTTCEFDSASGDSQSISGLTVSTIVPFPSLIPPQDPSGSESSVPMEQIPRQVVEFHFKMAGPWINDTFSRWIGPQEKIEENRKILVEIVEPPKQNFLAYRLPEGSQLTQIQNAALSSFAMKPIKPPTEGGRPKRRSAPRKSAHDPPGSPTAKRKRQPRPKNQVPPPPIACFACGQANVPLIMGGRYCRPCVEGGRVGETSQVITATVLDKQPNHDSVQHPLNSADPDPSPQSASQPDNMP